MVVPTKDLIENESNGTASILRVLKIHKPDETQYPLQGRTTFGKDDPGLSEALGNQEPTLEDQDAEMTADDDGNAQQESFQLSTAHAVHDETWLPFMRHIKDREGWYEYADAHVNVKRDCDHYISPNSKISVEDYPYRTTCHRKDDAWFILDQNFILCPKYEEWNQSVARCEVMLTIFHKGILDLRDRTEEVVKVGETIPGDDPSDEDMIEVINPSNGEVEKIRRDDPQYYSADGFKTRRYKGSSKPIDIPSFVWQSMSVKARREAIRREQMKLARDGAEKKKAARAEQDLAKLEKSKKGVTSIINQLHHTYHPNEDDVPTMPTCKYSQDRQRVKCARVSIMSGEKIINTLVARPVNKKEIDLTLKLKSLLTLSGISSSRKPPGCTTPSKNGAMSPTVPKRKGRKYM